MVILTEASRSPSVAAMRKRLPEAKWFEYEPVSCNNQRAGAQKIFGRPLRAVPDLSKAAVIVSIDADLFHGDPMSIKYNRDFATGRKLRPTENSGATMNRLYVIESGFSITGSMAEHRRGVIPPAIPAMVSSIMAVINGGAPNKNLPQDLADFVSKLAADVNANRGKAVFVAGPRQMPDVHTVIAGLNAMINAPVAYYADPEDPRDEKGWTPHSEQIKAFAEAAKTADAVLILGANPALTAPADLGIADILKKAKLVVHFGQHEDETAQASHWHLPQAHFLEAWGDVRTYDGTVSITQPLIEPIFGGKSTIELLALLSGHPQAGMEIVRATAAADYLKGRASEWNWKQSLFNGVVEGSARAPEKLTPPAGGTNVAALNTDFEHGGAFYFVPFAGAAYDGRFANNGWLMELPDPMTRVSWDNPLIVSPKTAAEKGWTSDDRVMVSLISDRNVQVEATVYVLPGQPENSFSMALGYGRDKLGAVAHGVGTNGYALITAKDIAAGKGAIFIDVTKVGDKVNRLACVQDHHIIDKVGKDRMHTIVPELVVEGTYKEWQHKPQLEGVKKVISLSMWNEYNYDEVDQDGNFKVHKWGMAIDLTTCTACSACVVACQSENNVPIVGKEMVYRGREMHWLRIDRYFKWTKDASGNVDETSVPQTVHQPLMCVHCENAPCEEVCPVAATTHSHEGLNMMTYNRCIGTRYCSNNCPYKVRRFNFFDYNSGTTNNLYTPNIIREDINELHKMSKNPNVTVRSRGVMEKCTYCVQRIESARIEIRAKHRGGKGEPMIWPDGTVVTACQQACPTDAIVFGDLHDKNSRVSKLHALAQSYALLDPELNTKPRTQYLAKVRNPLENLDRDFYTQKTHEGHGGGHPPETAPGKHETHSNHES